MRETRLHVDLRLLRRAARTLRPAQPMRRWLPTALVFSTILVGLIACDAGEPSAPQGSHVMPTPTPMPPPPTTVGPAQVAHEGVCGEGDDVVLDAFCGDTKPSSLLELRERLGIGDYKGYDDTKRAPIFGIVTSSTSLAVRGVSEANPRLILQGRDRGGPVYLAFARGSAVVELAAHDRNTMALTFYLVRFDAPGGAGALLLPAGETGWTNVTLTRDADLEDTPHDCLGCHRPDGPSGKKRLIIREVERPWLHWMGKDTFRAKGTWSCSHDTDCDAEGKPKYDARESRDPGVAVAEAFVTVHAPDETYGSVRVSDLLAHEIDYMRMEVSKDDPGRYEKQSFPAKAVFEEVIRSTPAQPFLNTPIGSSATWVASRKATLDAPIVQPFPYQDAKASDPAALARYAATYRDVLANKAPGSALVAASDLLLPAAKQSFLIEMEPDLPGEDVLHRACTQCHNDRVRPDLRRARFDASNLSKNSKAEKELAIARMRLPVDDPRHMPPTLFRDLDEASIQAAITTLRQ